MNPFKSLGMMSIIILSIFLFSMTSLTAQAVNDNSVAVEVGSSVITPALTNTDPSIINVINKTEEVKSLIDQWKIVADQIKGGMFSFGLLALTILPLLIISLITVGVILVLLLRTITIFTSDEIDKKIDVVEDWITKYLIKIPITILSKLKGLKKKKE